MKLDLFGKEAKAKAEEKLAEAEAAKLYTQIVNKAVVVLLSCKKLKYIDDYLYTFRRIEPIEKNLIIENSSCSDDQLINLINEWNNLIDQWNEKNTLSILTKKWEREGTNLNIAFPYMIYSNAIKERMIPRKPDYTATAGRVILNGGGQKRVVYKKGGKGEEYVKVGGEFVNLKRNYTRISGV